MARPTKIGLDYFPLDVDMDQDDKVALIEATHGIEGFAIVVKIFMKIYDNGYFYQWSEKEQLLFSKRVNVDINKVNVIINDCLKWGLFDQSVYDSSEILTSKGIQQRFLEATSRRKKVKIPQNYLLLDEETINAYKNLVIEHNNNETEEDNAELSTQSKVEESKVKESKAAVKEKTTANAVVDRFLELKPAMHPSPKDQAAADLIEQEGVPPDLAVQYLEQCFEEYIPKHPRDKINSLNYCTGFILDRYHESKQPKDNVTQIPQAQDKQSDQKQYNYGF